MSLVKTLSCLVSHLNRPSKANGLCRTRPISRSYQSPCESTRGKPLKPCLDIDKVEILWGKKVHEPFIESFMYMEFWPREPVVTSLWLNLCSDQLRTLTDKYCFTGDRLLAFEKQDRTNELRMVGFAAAYKIHKWHADEYEAWGHGTRDMAAKTRLYFLVHCIRKANLFKKHNVDHYYEVEILGSAREVSRTGVATKLLRAAIEHAIEMNEPLITVTATNAYAQKVCEKCGMQKEWSMRYEDCIDYCGRRVFYPRVPHSTVAVYSRQNTCFDSRNLYFNKRIPFR